MRTNADAAREMREHIAYLYASRVPESDWRDETEKYLTAKLDELYPESLGEDRVECERCGKQGCDLCIPVDDGNTYACWRCRIPIREIKTDDDYKEAMAYVDAHMDDDENSDLQVVAILIEDYERRSSKPPVPESLEAAVRGVIKEQPYRFRGSAATVDAPIDDVVSAIVDAVAPLLAEKDKERDFLHEKLERLVGAVCRDEPLEARGHKDTKYDAALFKIEEKDKQIAELKWGIDSALASMDESSPTVDARNILTQIRGKEALND